MKSIEENTERLDLLQKTLEIEQRQQKRLMDLARQKQREKEEAERRKLFDATNTAAPTAATLDQDEVQSRQLIDEVAKTSPPNAPVVRVLTNINGNFMILIL